MIIDGIKNKFFIMYGDAANTKNVYVGDSSVQELETGSQIGNGLVLVPFSSANNVQYSNLIPIFITDSDQLYMIGTANDVLHVIIFDDPNYLAAQELIAALQPQPLQPLIDRLDTLIALVKSQTMRPKI